MSAAEHQSPKASSAKDGQSLKKPPQRPPLLQPPARQEHEDLETAPPMKVKVVPAKPATPPIAAEPETPPAPAVAAAPAPVPGSHPIAPPSEPMQYRAIGLIRGRYQPSEEQLNRGEILADDGSVIEAVLLGRITSLIKKHIDLETSHLWVVYPRTRQGNEDREEREEREEFSSCALHLQIVGVWEPETLGMPGENPRNSHGQMAGVEADDSDETLDDETDSADEIPAAETSAAETKPEGLEPSDLPGAPLELPSENYFSIRGEILNYDEETHQIMVKIVQGSKRAGKPPKAFRLHVAGQLTGKTVGYFWELDVERQDEILVLIEGRSVGIVPPKKKKKGGRPFGGPRGKRRPGPGIGGDKPKPSPNKDKPRIRPSAPVKSNPL